MQAQFSQEKPNWQHSVPRLQCPGKRARHNYRGWILTLIFERYIAWYWLDSDIVTTRRTAQRRGIAR